MLKTRYLVLLMSVLLLSACEQDVVLDLNKIEKRLVVAANVSNDVDVARVVLSYSQGFYDESEAAVITDAKVIMVNDEGEEEQLTLNDNGVYVSQLMQAEFGTQYTLHVDVEEYTFEVTQELLSLVEIERVVFIPNPFLDDDDSLNVFVEVEDPKGEDDFFRLLVNKIGATQSDEFYLVDDSYGKDGTITMPVYYKNFTPGDTLVIELRHISSEIYTYYSGLSENINGSFNSIAPGNPTSNMPDDVLGYFAAYSVDRDTIIVSASSY
jgi:hypothetical protein